MKFSFSISLFIVFSLVYIQSTNAQYGAVYKGKNKTSSTNTAQPGPKYSNQYPNEYSAPYQDKRAIYNLKKDTSLGTIFGINLNRSETATNGENFAANGNSFIIGGFLTTSLYKKYELKVSVINFPYIGNGAVSTTTCGATSSRDCFLNMNYLNALGEFYYPFFTNDKIRAKVGAGFSLLFPQTKSSNFLELGNQSINFAFNGSLAMDVSIDYWYYLPIGVSAYWYPNKNSMTMSTTSAYIGFGFYLK